MTFKYYSVKIKKEKSYFIISETKKDEKFWSVGYNEDALNKKYLFLNCGKYPFLK